MLRRLAMRRLDQVLEDLEDLDPELAARLELVLDAHRARALVARCEGAPIPQARPRFGVAYRDELDPLSGAPTRRAFAKGRNADPRSAAFRGAMGWAFKGALRGADPLEGPLAVHVRAVFPRPRAARGAGRAWHVGAGDADNVAKAVLDAGGVTRAPLVWRDDRQVAHLVVSKLIAAEGEAPHVEVDVARLLEVVPRGGVECSSTNGGGAGDP